jgi:prephenate dehydratase
MAKPQRVTYFKISLEDKAGSLLGIAQDLKSRKIGLVSLGGQDMEGGRAEVYLIARNPDKLRTAWKSSGMSFEEGTGFFVKGTDRTGVLVDTLDALAKAGVNIVKSEAMGVGGNYGLFLRVAPSDVERTAQALNAK